MQRHHIAAALPLLVNLACTQPFAEWEKDYETKRVQDEALAMRQAAERARATLDDFLVKAKSPPAGTKSYAVKVGVQDAGGTEYFWIEELSWSNGSFMGRINDEPRLVKSVKPGQIHKFSRSDIVDWIYIDEKSGKTFGNFTACVRSSNNRPAPAGGLKGRNDLECP